jgi:hypothetical protein
MEWYLVKQRLRLHGVVLSETEDTSSWCGTSLSTGSTSPLPCTYLKGSCAKSRRCTSDAGDVEVL